MLLKPPHSLRSSIQLQVLKYVDTLIIKQRSFNDFRLIKLSNNVKRRRAKKLIKRSERNTQEVMGLTAAVPFIAALQGDSELLAQVNQVLSDHYYISGKLLSKYSHIVAPQQDGIEREEEPTELIRSSEAMQSIEEVGVGTMYNSYDNSGVSSVEENKRDQSTAHEHHDDIIQHGDTPPSSGSSSPSLSKCCTNNNNFNRRSILRSSEVPSLVKPVVLRSGGTRKSLS